MKKRKWALKDILALQAVFIVYSISSIVAKLASAQLSTLQSVFTVKFMILGILEVGILGFYALLWQQVIKKWELSVAYANKAMTLLWGLLWGLLIFHEQITGPKVLGILVVFLGIIVMNSEREGVHES